MLFDHAQHDEQGRCMSKKEREKELPMCSSFYGDEEDPLLVSDRAKNAPCNQTHTALLHLGYPTSSVGHAYWLGIPPLA
ncbi:hypothetical protein VIMY103929_15645 [Vibrio mytili]